MKQIVLFFSLVFPVLISAQPVFQKSYGGLLANSGSGYEVVETANGDLVTTGFFMSSIGTYGISLWKTDAAGNTLWAKMYPTATFHIQGFSLRETPDGFIIGGQLSNMSNSNTDMVFIKTDSVGTLQWAKFFSNSTYDGCSAMRVVNDTNYIAAGNNSASSLLVLLGSNGARIWAKRYTGTTGSLSIQHTFDNGYIFTSRTTNTYIPMVVKLNATGNVSWARSFPVKDARSVIQLPDSGYAVAGKYEPGSGGFTSYVARLDASGNMLWIKSYARYNSDAAFSIEATADGGFLLAGVSNDIPFFESEPIVFKLDSVGNVQWARTHGGGQSSTEELYYALPLMNNGVAAVGRTTGFSLGSGSDIYLMKADSNGAVGCLDTLVTLVTTTLPIVTSAATVTAVNETALTQNLTCTTELISGDNTPCNPLNISAQQNESSSLRVFPNPFTSGISFELGNANEPRTDSTVELFDVFGKKVAGETFSGGKTFIARGDLAAGIYFYRVISADLLISGKIIAE
jgi:hypothetical protein